MASPMADILLHKRLLLPERRAIAAGMAGRQQLAAACSCAAATWMPSTPQLKRPSQCCCGGTGLGAVNDGKETGAELTGRTRGAEKLSDTTGTAAGKAGMPRTLGCAEGDGLPANAARHAERSSIWRCML